MKTFSRYISTWFTSIRLARRYGIEGAIHELRKEIMMFKMRYYKNTGRRWGSGA